VHCRPGHELHDHQTQAYLTPPNLVWLIYALWLGLVVYLTVSAVGVKRETGGHLWQTVGLTVAIIAAFLFAGVLMTLDGMAFLVWARQHLGASWATRLPSRRIMNS
jgi:hypothetical protein